MCVVCVVSVTECLSSFICSKIEGHEVSEAELKCPRVDCVFPLSHATLRGLTEGLSRPEVYEKFLTFCTDQYLQAAIEAGGAMRCPSDSCNYVFQWRPEGTSFAFQCEKCQSQYCLNCSLVESSGGQQGGGGGGGIGPGHAPLTCEQQREKMEQQAEERVKFEQWKAMNARATELFDQMVTSNGWKRKLQVAFVLMPVLMLLRSPHTYMPTQHPLHWPCAYSHLMTLAC